MTRLHPVKAYWRKSPDRPHAFAQIHIELGRAYLIDQALSVLERELENSDLTQEQIATVGEWV